MKKLLFIPILFLLGCNMQKYIANHPELLPPATIKEVTNIIVKDSISYIPADSSIFSLLFECDSNNQVLMRNLQESSSKGVKTNVKFENNRLDLSMYIDSIGVLNRIINNYKFKEVIKVNPVNTELQKKVLKVETKLHNRNIQLLTVSVLFVLSILVIIFLLKIK